MTQDTPLARAAEKVGSASALARMINRSQSTMADWMKRGWPSADACRAIAEAVPGVVTIEDLLAPATHRKKERKAKRKAKSRKAA